MTANDFYEFLSTMTTEEAIITLSPGPIAIRVNSYDRHAAILTSKLKTAASDTTTIGDTIDLLNRAVFLATHKLLTNEPPAYRPGVLDEQAVDLLERLKRQWQAEEKASPALDDIINVLQFALWWLMFLCALEG
jgi:hypothetical protein